MSVKSTLVDDLGGSEKNIFSLHTPPPPPHPPINAINPEANPLGTYETKMAVRTGQRSILTILRKNSLLETISTSKKYFDLEEREDLSSLACSRRPDCRDDPKRCDEEKQQRNPLSLPLPFSSSYFPRSLADFVLQLHCLN